MKLVKESLRDVLKPKDISEIDELIGDKFDVDPNKVITINDYAYASEKALRNLGNNFDLKISVFGRIGNKVAHSKFFLTGKIKDLYKWWKYFNGADEDFNKLISKIMNESLEDILKPKSEEEIEKGILQKYKGKGVQIFIDGMKDFIIVKAVFRRKVMYYFIPKKNPTVQYMYGIKKGNIYMKRDDLYAIRELRSGSYVFNKGNPNKMAMPKDLYGAAEWIKERYNITY